MENLRKLGRPVGALEIWVGYEELREPNEMARRSLPQLSEAYFRSLAPAYRSAGVKLAAVSAVGNEALKGLNTDWAKRLAYGRQEAFTGLSVKCFDVPQ